MEEDIRDTEQYYKIYNEVVQYCKERGLAFVSGMDCFYVFNSDRTFIREASSSDIAKQIADEYFQTSK